MVGDSNLRAAETLADCAGSRKHEKRGHSGLTWLGHGRVGTGTGKLGLVTSRDYRSGLMDSLHLRGEKFDDPGGEDCLRAGGNQPESG